MQGIKKGFNADRKENYVSITDFITEQNHYEFSCGKCGKIFYADKETFENINGLSNKVWTIRSFAKIAAGDTKKRLTKLGRMTRKHADNPGKHSSPRLFILFIYLIFANSRF